MFEYSKPETKQKEKPNTAIQKKEQELTRPNQTGIPDTMKTRFENLSGFSFDDVRIHYNSDKPAHLQALAYTQGNQVYVAPGQEVHLGHELGHVVQQKTGNVRRTSQIRDVNINDDSVLETEADQFGSHSGQVSFDIQNMPIQRKLVSNVVQLTKKIIDEKQGICHIYSSFPKCENIELGNSEAGEMNAILTRIRYPKSHVELTLEWYDPDTLDHKGFLSQHLTFNEDLVANPDRFAFIDRKHAVSDEREQELGYLKCRFNKGEALSSDEIAKLRLSTDEFSFSLLLVSKQEKGYQHKILSPGGRVSAKALLDVELEIIKSYSYDEYNCIRWADEKIFNSPILAEYVIGVL